MGFSKYVIYISYYSAPIPVILVLFFIKLWHDNESITSFQILVILLLIIHYVKRLLETCFVHRNGNYDLSLGTMLSGALYYCIFGSGLIEYQILFMNYTEPTYPISGIPYIFVSLMLFTEYMNLRAHIVLRNLRPPGTTKRGIPYGYGFGCVSCANYMWEFLSWVFFTCLVQSLFSIIFCVIGFITMYIMARAKHKAYIEYFNGIDREEYPPNRKAMIPLIL